MLTGQLKALENNRRFRWLSIVGRLKAEVGIAEARAAMTTMWASTDTASALTGTAAGGGAHAAVARPRVRANTLRVQLRPARVVRERAHRDERDQRIAQGSASPIAVAAR